MAKKKRARKQYVNTRIDGSVYLFVRESHEGDVGDEDGCESSLVCREFFAAFRGTHNEAQSYAACLAASETEDGVVFTFQRVPLVVPSGVTIEGSGRR